MSLFNRMREMARASAEKRLVLPSAEDEEGQIALSNLREIWRDTKKHLNEARNEGEAEFSIHDVRSPEKLTLVMEGIARDEALAFEGWNLGHDGVSFVKVFDTHAQTVRARELLARVDFADGAVTCHIPPAEGERELKELKNGPRLERKLEHRERHATRLAVRRDWMEEFAKQENKMESLPTR